jgi:hypothetical protein
MTGLGRRLAKLEGSGCDMCRVTPETGFKSILRGIPPKPGSNAETVEAGREEGRCPGCGRPPWVIRLKGLSEKPRGPAPA